MPMPKASRYRTRPPSVSALLSSQSFEGGGGGGAQGGSGGVPGDGGASGGCGGEATGQSSSLSTKAYPSRTRARATQRSDVSTRGRRPTQSMRLPPMRQPTSWDVATGTASQMTAEPLATWASIRMVTE